MNSPLKTFNVPSNGAISVTSKCGMLFIKPLKGTQMTTRTVQCLDTIESTSTSDDNTLVIVRLSNKRTGIPKANGTGGGNVVQIFSLVDPNYRATITLDSSVSTTVAWCPNSRAISCVDLDSNNATIYRLDDPDSPPLKLNNVKDTRLDKKQNNFKNDSIAFNETNGQCAVLSTHGISGGDFVSVYDYEGHNGLLNRFDLSVPSTNFNADSHLILYLKEFILNVSSPISNANSPHIFIHSSKTGCLLKAVVLENISSGVRDIEVCQREQKMAVITYFSERIFILDTVNFNVTSEYRHDVGGDDDLERLESFMQTKYLKMYLESSAHKQDDNDQKIEKLSVAGSCNEALVRHLVEGRVAAAIDNEERIVSDSDVGDGDEITTTITTSPNRSTRRDPTASHHNKIHVLDEYDSSFIPTIQGQDGKQRKIVNCSWSEKGRFLASMIACCPQTVFVWDTDSLGGLCAVLVFKYPVSCISWGIGKINGGEETLAIANSSVGKINTWSKFGGCMFHHVHSMNDERAVGVSWGGIGLAVVRGEQNCASISL